MKKQATRLAKATLLLFTCTMLASCEEPRVYGSIGYSTYRGGGYYSGGPSVGGSITIGGRIR